MKIMKNIMKCFLLACGLVLLKLFFACEDEVITKKLIGKFVLEDFTIVLIVASFRWSFRWVSEEPFSFLEKLPEAMAVTYLKEDKKEDESGLEVIRIHEAGHVVMAYLLGIEVIECVATADEGRTQTRINQATMNSKDYEKLILLDYAGAVSEKVILGEFKAGSLGKNSDFEQAEQRIKNLLLLNNEIYGYTTGGEHFDKLVREKSAYLFDKAYSIIFSHQDSVLKIAEQLRKNPIMSGKKLRECINKELPIIWASIEELQNFNIHTTDLNKEENN